MTTPAHKTGRTVHSPGPWREVQGGTMIADRDGMFVAHVTQGISGGSSERTKANARLLVAAPDMQKALEQLLRCCENHPAFTNPANQITVGRAEAARAALSASRSPGET